MTPHKQLIRHDPDNGQWGDCWRTAVACLLDMPPADVPHLNGPDYTQGQQSIEMRAWLAERRLTLFDFAWPGDQPLDMLLASLVHVVGDRPLHFMVSGTSPRDTVHVVIATIGGVVHDPHPDGGGLIGPVEDGNWWIGFLGALT